MLKNNNLKIKITLVSFAFCLVLILTLFINSSMSIRVNADQPPAVASAGSADDPLVTLSYINKIYTPTLSKAIDTAIAAALVSYRPQQAQPLIAQNSAGSAGLVILELTKGQKIRAKSSPIEISLRPGGTAMVISDYQTQGIADWTTGDELLNGAAVPINHQLIIPRPDSRSIIITSLVANVIVRGDYEIFE